MTFGFGFCSVLYKVGFRCGSGPCTFFTFGFGLGSVLAGFGFSHL